MTSNSARGGDSATPMDHVLRPKLPWRDEPDRTECGKPVVDFGSVITKDAFVAKVNKQGKQRASMSTCMTCWHTCERHHVGDDPGLVLAATLEREMQGSWRRSDERNELLRRELVAIQMLVAEHRGEFDALVSGLGDATSLADRRAEKRLAATRGARR